MTPRQLFTDVLQDIGVLGIADRPQNADLQLALRRANDWIDSLALEGMTVYYLPRTTQTLAASTPTYTIGTGGAINIVRPVEIERAGLIIDTTVAAAQQTEIEIEVYTEQDYAAIPQKSLTGTLIQGIRFDHNWSAGLGLITIYPIPTIGTTQLVIYTRQALAEFPTLDTNVTYPPGYREFLRTNLAKKFAASWGKTLTQDQRDNARDASAKVKRGNIRPEVVQFDSLTPGLTQPGGFNWRTGE